MKKKLGNAATNEVAKSVLPKIVIGGMAIGAGYLLLIRPILMAIGVIKSSEEKQLDQQTEQFATSNTSPFSPQYYKGKSVKLTRAGAQAIAQQIYDAKTSFGWVGDDDEDSLYAAFRKIPTRNDLSWIADNFQLMFSKDLYSYVRGFLSDNEIAIVHGIVNNLA